MLIIASIDRLTAIGFAAYPLYRDSLVCKHLVLERKHAARSTVDRPHERD